MGVASSEFAADPCSSMKRGAMVRAARALLSAVTRLLILADMVDVHLLLKSLRVVCDDCDDEFSVLTFIIELNMMCSCYNFDRKHCISNSCQLRFI